MKWNKRNDYIWFDIAKNKQIEIHNYDWRNAILNWTINGKKPIYHISIEIFRFKIQYHNYGSI